MLSKTLFTALVLCATSAATEAQDLYDTTVLRSLNFTFHDANWWTLLEQNYDSQTNILADLEVEGTVYPDVGVRIRGWGKGRRVGLHTRSVPFPGFVAPLPPCDRRGWKALWWIHNSVWMTETEDRADG